MSLTDLFQTVTGADDAGPREARNGLRHAGALTMTKVADGLIDPKLVLTWLANALGAPAALVALLVPIREAGALLPQIALAKVVQGMARRKWMWVAGSAGQGVFAAAIVLAALTLSGTVAGLAICAALAGLALSRAACSVSYKDILGKTVEKTRRGAVTGVAGSASSAFVLGFALLLLSGLLEDRGPVIVAIAIAALLWGVAAALFSTLEEEPTENTEDPPGVNLSLLREDPQLTRFILARGALVATALAPPYMVLLAGGEGGAALEKLGALVLASAGASLLSSYIWGRFADRSSRQTMAVAGVCAAAAMMLAVALAVMGLAERWWAMPGALFLLMISYHGVRQSRSTHLVDMAPEDKRSAYAALANTCIGVLLLVAGAIGGAGALFGATTTLVLYAALSVLGAGIAVTLREVQKD